MSDERRHNFRQGLETTKKQLEATRTQLEETNAKIEKKAGRNLFLAIGSGLVFGAVFLGSLFLYAPLFVWLVVALVLIASLELATAFRAGDRRVSRIGILIAASGILYGAYFYGSKGMVFALLGSILFLGAWRLIEGAFFGLGGPQKTTIIRDIVSGLFVLVYVGFLGSLAILIFKGVNGAAWIFTLVAVVVSIDIGAYAAGITLGKHKMTPVISPNKTWEGFIGAAVTGAVVAVLCSIFLLKIDWWQGLFLGIAVLLTATIGDLTASLIKRNIGIKDMSNWIPGHGGFLDRLDSLLPSTVPVFATALLVGVV